MNKSAISGGVFAHLFCCRRRRGDWTSSPLAEEERCATKNCRCNLSRRIQGRLLETQKWRGNFPYILVVDYSPAEQTEEHDRWPLRLPCTATSLEIDACTTCGQYSLLSLRHHHPSSSAGRLLAWDNEVYRCLYLLNCRCSCVSLEATTATEISGCRFAGLNELCSQQKFKMFVGGKACPDPF